MAEQMNFDTTRNKADHPAPGNAACPLGLTIVRQWRGVPEPIRSAAARLQSSCPVTHELS
jgi:hypothetical protein